MVHMKRTTVMVPKNVNLAECWAKLLDMTDGYLRERFRKGECVSNLLQEVFNVDR